MFAQSADRIVLDRALRLRAVQRVIRDADFAEGVAFGSHECRVSGVGCRKSRVTGQAKTGLAILRLPTSDSRPSRLRLHRVQPRLRLFENVLVQRLAVRIHRYNRHEVFHPQMPDRLGGSEVHPIDAVDAFDRCGTNLRGAADRVEGDGAVLLARRQRLLPHPALADDAADTVVAHDLPLWRLRAWRGRRPRRFANPLLALFHHHRSAVINDLPREVDRRLGTGVDSVMDGVASGVEPAGDGDGVTDVEGSDRCFVDWGGEFYEGHFNTTTPSRFHAYRAALPAADMPSTCTRSTRRTMPASD